MGYTYDSRLIVMQVIDDVTNHESELHVPEVTPKKEKLAYRS